MNEIQLADSGRRSTVEIVGRFVHSYAAKDASVSDADWLAGELARDGVVRPEEANAILKGMADYRESRDELTRRLERGESRTRFVRDCLEAGAKAIGVTNICAYASRIDKAVSDANQMMWDTVHRVTDGGVKRTATLFGNIAEAQLAGTAAINQAVTESPVTTIQPRVNKLASADTMVIESSTGKVISQQQMKWYPTAEKAIEAWDAKDYTGQTLIVPQEQVARIKELRPDIDVRASIDGSPGLSFEAPQEIQRQVQEKGTVPQRDWSDADVAILSKHILGESVQAGIWAVGIQAAATLGRRMWNSFVGQPNKSFEQDLTQFAEDAAKSGMAASATTAVAGGLVTAARSNLLGSALAAAPAGAISALACVAVENVKILNKLGNGEITSSQALDQSGDNTCALIGSLAVGADFAAKGTILFPGIGTVVGALVGGAIGHMGGHAIYEGAKRAVKAVGNFISRTAASVKNAVSRAWRATVICSDPAPSPISITRAWSAVKSWFA